MKLPKFSLKARLALSLALLLLVCSGAMFATFDYQTQRSMIAAAQARQDTSLRILVDQFSSVYDGIEVEMSPHGQIEELRWAALPELDGHAVIDRVGQISGETATLFGWDAAEGDFIRLTTNIIKPDGSRAVGTWLGKQNPVHASMLRKETFRGEAVILGKPYFTVYEPIVSPGGEVIGILYVGVDRSVIDAQVARNRLVGVGLSLAFLTLGILALIFLLSRNLGPLWQITARLGHMSDGDLESDVPHQSRGDEIGDTARVVEEFRTKLARAHDQDVELERRRQAQERAVAALREGLERLANRDLGARIGESADMPPDYEELRADFNIGVESLAQAMAEVETVAFGVRGAATEIGSTSDDLARRVEEQAATLEKSAAALDALAGAGAEIATNAEEADRLATNSRRLSSESEAVLGRAIEAIARIEDASSKINNIITAIDDIAFQTNLLALNAGVEAARAGEAGRGFAVVASEVRSLAQTAAEAAQEIKTLIRASNDEVREGSNLVQQTGASLGQVLEQVDSLGKLISEIAGSVRTQTDGLSEINSSVQQLEGMTQHNAAVVEELNAAGQSLNTEAQRLSETLGVFEGANGAPRPARKAAESQKAPEPARAAADAWDAPAQPRPALAATGTDDGWADF
ncbi:methyl-accepting chemotaxis protein [uncultured Salipiger sp.]|uniref:methyl-accepting chemotaxis protein n=2 Tax=Salipiger TaxID=263377 RepID=UPI0025958154|nr:methyl-accepting chemotaxis protein [uncultured Salipiger sp.]